MTSNFRFGCWLSYQISYEMMHANHFVNWLHIGFVDMYNLALSSHSQTLLSTPLFMQTFENPQCGGLLERPLVLNLNLNSQEETNWLVYGLQSLSVVLQVCACVCVFDIWYLPRYNSQEKGKERDKERADREKTEVRPKKWNSTAHSWN